MTGGEAFGHTALKKLLPGKYTLWPGLRAKLVNYKGTAKRKSGSLCGPGI